MANLPSDPTTLCVNAEKLVLQVGTNPDTYTCLQDLRFNVGRPVLREPITGLGTTNPSGSVITAIYFFGAGNNTLDCTVLMSEAEYATFQTNTLRDANGQMPSQFYKIVATNFSGTVQTLGNTHNTPAGFKASIATYTVDKPIIGGVKLRLHLQLLEDQITVS